MAAPLSICTKEEMRAVIRFLFAEIIRRMQAQYGDSCLSRSKIYEWIERFKQGRTSLCDDERSGRPSTSTTEDNVQVVEGIVMERGETVNSANYCEVLRTKLKPAIRSKRRGKLRKGVLLQQDNARPHSAQRTAETIKELGFEVLEHPPYSPDLAPSDFHMFGPLKEALRGRRFATDEEVIDAVKKWLKMQPKNFFSNGIKQLVKRWERCVEVQGSYVVK